MAAGLLRCSSSTAKESLKAALCRLCGMIYFCTGASGLVSPATVHFRTWTLWPRLGSLLQRQAHKPVPLNIVLLGMRPPAEFSLTAMPWGVLKGEANCEDCSEDETRGALTPEVLLKAQQ